MILFVISSMNSNQNYQKIVLKNGLRLITVPMAGTQAATVLVLFGVGSKYESRKLSGLSHFIEHMFFKGTQKRPNTLAIAETLDRIGGEYNAFTSQEITGYWAKAASEHLDILLDWVSDILLHSKFDPQEIDRERGVITEEINMYQDMPAQYVGVLWEKLLYGDQPAGWPVIGFKENISSFTLQQFLDYRKSHYLASNAVIVVAGKIDVRSLPSKTEQYFGALSDASKVVKQPVIEQQAKPELLIFDKATDQTHFCLGNRAYPFGHPDEYALAILAIILGGNMSSRLFIQVRERLVTQAGVDHQKAGKAISAILAEYQKVVNEPIGEDELQKAKDCIRGHIILEMESSDEQASFFAGQELLENKILTIEQKLAKINGVSVMDLSRVARDIFQPAKLNLALIGPFKDKEKFEKLLTGVKPAPSDDGDAVESYVSKEQISDN